MNIVKDIELFIFDLDGTLYEDTDHFDYYATLMRNHLPKDKQDRFEDEYTHIKQGNHLISFGKAYDADRDTIITLDPMTIEVSEVHEWDGQAWSQAKIKEVYHEPLKFDYEHMVAIGDGWWPPYVVARHLGLSVEDAGTCYIKTKEYMVTDQFQLTKTPGLIDTLKALKKDKKVVLMTNSERDDVDRLLSELGLTGLFTEEITSAFKPANTVSHFERLLKEYHVKPEQALAIGDNFINECAPALQMGMKAIYISPHQAPVDHQSLTIVPTLEMMLPKML